jgi:hypothetical protein
MIAAGRPRSSSNSAPSVIVCANVHVHACVWILYQVSHFKIYYMCVHLPEIIFAAAARTIAYRMIITKLPVI